MQSTAPKPSPSPREPEAPDPAWWLGFAREEFTCFEPGRSMWGWGSPGNIPVRAATPLYVRAFAAATARDAPPYVFACLELGMLSEAVHRTVLERLRGAGVALDAHRLTLTATHTHSAPSGTSTYFFYGMAGPGFIPAIHERIVHATVTCILRALQASGPGRLYAVSEDLPRVEPVCFNRSIAAYNRNPDVEPVGLDRADEALHRRMTVLRAEDERGRARGLVSFFAVHGTSVHSDATFLHSDNKGMASRDCERAARETDEATDDFVAIFAQESAGDVSPNYRFDPRRGWMAGRCEDDTESAAFNGAIQAAHAMRLLREARAKGRPLEATCQARVLYRSFPEVRVDPQFADGREDRHPGTGVLGLTSGVGTREGPGPMAPFRHVLRGLTQAWGRAAPRVETPYTAVQGAKLPLWDVGFMPTNKIIGTFAATGPLSVTAPATRRKFYHKALKFPGVRTLPWVPHHLPVQIVRLGDLALGFVSFEPTTQCGRRLRALLELELRSLGVREAVLAGYANAYSSYLTTPEEYDLQDYEGAMTLYGRWSLGAVGTMFRRVAEALREGAPNDSLGELPPRVPETEWLPDGSDTQA